MIALEAGSDFEVDHQSSAAPWGDPYRLWSLWDMFNFIFPKWHRLLDDLGILIRVSRSNIRDTREDPAKSATAMVDCANNAKDLVKLAGELNSALNSAHLAAAARRLKYWPTQDNHEWSELNTKARGLRDVIETELGQYLYYRYPKESGSNSYHGKLTGKMPLRHPLAFNVIFFARQITMH
jgi:hypothetical protein